MRRYGRAHFLKDAIKLGLTPQTAFSRMELRRRRDRLIILHHPDRGGDAAKAATINAIYARMLKWLEKREAKIRESAAINMQANAVRPDSPAAAKIKRGSRATRLWAMAIAAAAAYAALRPKQRP